MGPLITKVVAAVGPKVSKLAASGAARGLATGMTALHHMGDGPADAGSPTLTSQQFSGVAPGPRRY